MKAEGEHSRRPLRVKVLTDGGNGWFCRRPNRSEGGATVRLLLRTNNPVELSFLGALLADAGIESLVLDEYTSVMEGSIGAIPRRLMVADAQFDAACRVLSEAGFDVDRD